MNRIGAMEPDPVDAAQGSSFTGCREDFNLWRHQTVTPASKEIQICKNQNGRVRRWPCGHLLRSEPDARLSPHPAQADAKPRISGEPVSRRFNPCLPTTNTELLLECTLRDVRLPLWVERVGVPPVFTWRLILVSRLDTCFERRKKFGTQAVGLKCAIAASVWTQLYC